MTATLTEAELAHAASIADPDDAVVTAPIPAVSQPRVLVASVVRKSAPIVRAFAETLTWQRAAAEFGALFLLDLDGLPDATESEAALRAAFPMATFAPAPAPAVGDYTEDAAGTRGWSAPAFARMATNRNAILAHAIAQRFDAVWLLDADVLCDPTTLASLLAADASIVSAVYWTRWQPTMPPLPQVWLRHPYALTEAFGFGADPADFLGALATRRRLRVGGLGACTLIRTDAIRKGVTYARVDGLAPGPMADGEDRHFCERARRLHVPLVADAWPDVWHCYRPADVDRIGPMLDRLRASVVERPADGDCVSVRLDACEPLQTGRGMMLPEPQWVRGRLGCLPLIPALEAAVRATPVGETRLVAVTYPSGYELATLRGARRIVRVSVLDAKRYAEPPEYA